MLSGWRVLVPVRRLGVVPADSGRASWAALVTFTVHAPCDPKIPLLGGCLCKMPEMFNASWFVLAQEERGAISLLYGRVVVARRRTMAPLTRLRH